MYVYWEHVNNMYYLAFMMIWYMVDKKQLVLYKCMESRWDLLDLLSSYWNLGSQYGLSRREYAQWMLSSGNTVGEVSPLLTHGYVPIFKFKIDVSAFL